MIGPHQNVPRMFAPGQEGISLIGDLLRRGNLVRLRVAGRSMMPWLEDGAVVTLRRISPGAVGPGDLVFFHAVDGQTLLHRVISSRQASDGTTLFLVKGDACARPDGLLPGSAILGKVVAVTRETPGGTLRHVNLESRFRAATNRVLALLSYRSPRLFCTLAFRLVPPWRRFRTCFSR